MKITFGKHSGSEVEDLPDEYLRWFVDSVKETAQSRDLIVEMEREIVFRRTGRRVTTTRRAATRPSHRGPQ